MSPKSNKTAHLCKILKKLLLESHIASFSVTKAIEQTETFQTLMAANAIDKVNKGAGRVFVALDKDAISMHLSFICPDSPMDDTRGERYNQIRMYRDSKTKSRKSYRLVFVRGRESYTINDKVHENTENDPIGKQLNSLKVKKLCFVENIENFMLNKHLINDGWILLYPIGRIGEQLLKKIDAKQILHYGDLDYVGLNEYATIRRFFPSANIHLPSNYFEDAAKFGKTISSNQKASDALISLSKEDATVRSILNFLHKKNLFLEQEGYTNE